MFQISESRLQIQICVGSFCGRVARFRQVQICVVSFLWNVGSLLWKGGSMVYKCGWARSVVLRPGSAVSSLESEM